MRFKLIFVFILFISLNNSALAQNYIPFYDATSSQVSQSNIISNLTSFENFGVKTRNSSAQANTLLWLKSKYLEFGFAPTQIVEDSYSYSGSTCKNLIVTKTGTLYPNTFVIICGHYDTVNGPGTNDNGSGVSVILEAARLLQNIPTQYSIKFINFSGEEDGLRGSQHYVDEIVNSTTPKMNIRLVINLDQVGGIAGEINNTITCERDLSTPSSNNAASSTMTSQLANCMELYSPLNTVISNAYGSDYVPFENNGEIITGLYETNESPYPHSSQDLLINLDTEYVFNVAKGTTGALMHFAIACTTCTLSNTEIEVASLQIYPNPATDRITIQFGESIDEYNVVISNTLGQQVFRKSFISNNAEIDVASFQKGLYIVTVENRQKTIVTRIVIK